MVGIDPYEDACRVARERLGTDQFAMSVLQMLRAWQFTRTGVQVTPTDGQSVAEAPEGKVYPSVPSTGKRPFRWFLRIALYLPVAVETLVGRSVALLAIGRSWRLALCVVVRTLGTEVVE